MREPRRTAGFSSEHHKKREHILKKLTPLLIVATSRIPLLREQLEGKDPKENFQQVEGLLQSLGYQANPTPHHKKRTLDPHHT